MARAHGNIEFGTLLDETDHGIELGRLAIDYDTEEFWELPATGDKAFPLPWQNVAHYLAAGAIRYDDPDMEKRLISFLRRKEDSEKQREAIERTKAEQEKVAKEVEDNNKLIAQTKLRAGMARTFWVMGCLVAIAATFIFTIPPAPPAAAEPTIAGVGADYGIPTDELAKASYIEALGDANTLYGVIVDQDIIEVGTATTGESTIKENVMLNPYVSEQPIHMRPLYYNRQTFYQSSLVVNDYKGGSSAVYLQNPKGYKDGKAANDLVLTGGPGISNITIASPDAYQALSGDDAASLLEDTQEEAADQGMEYEDPDRMPSSPPDGWLGFDSCDIDGTWVVASYWYRQSEMLGGNIMRRVIMYDVQNVLDSGAEGLANMNSVNLNYQVLDSSYYDPVVSTSKATNGQVHWIGYMKQDPSGGTGFFIRKVTTTTDILNEDFTNTFSMQDITGSRAPITNYTLDGDYLFFEQSGYIWYTDLSKMQVERSQYSDGQKIIKKNNPIQICSTSAIYPSVTRDEQFRADQTGVATVPRSHYKVMRITTSGGISYGIVYIDAASGDVVFVPTQKLIVAGTTEGNVSVDSNATDVQNQTQAEIDRIHREDQKTGEYAEGYDPTKPQQTQEQQPATGVSASTAGHKARGWTAVATEGMATGRQVEDTTVTKVIVATSERSDHSVSIVAFTIRGEHVIWIEEDKTSHERCVKCSPVYYKNDAVKIEEQIFGEDDSSSETDQVQQNEIAQGQQFQQDQAQQQAQQQQQQSQQQPAQQQQVAETTGMQQQQQQQQQVPGMQQGQPTTQ